MKKKKLFEYIAQIESPYKESIDELYQDNLTRILMAPGSNGAHHVWIGGYLDHILFMLKMAELLFEANEKHIDEFTFGDLVYVILLHDIEKPFRYTKPFNLKPTKEIISDLIEKYELKLEDKHLNALKYAHGENDDFVPGKRVMNELASYLHSCDVISARGHFNLKLE